MSWNGLVNAQTLIHSRFCVHPRKLSNLKFLDQFYLEEWANVPVARCAKLMKMHSMNLATLIAEKDGCKNYCLSVGGY